MNMMNYLRSRYDYSNESSTQQVIEWYKGRHGCMSAEDQNEVSPTGQTYDTMIIRSTVRRTHTVSTMHSNKVVGEKINDKIDLAGVPSHDGTQCEPSPYSNPP